MIEFKSADELKLKYVVYANFYKTTLSDGNIYTCRNVADIYNASYKTQIKNSKPKAIVIMMNPGKCEPKYSNYIIPELSLRELCEVSMKEPTVLCKADNAQYQIMRIMDIKRWKHVRILNLSDIRLPNGDEFKSLLKNLLLIYHSNVHSIFSECRTNERKNLFISEIGAPIILAWGTDPILISLAKQCINSIPVDKVRGVKHNDNLYNYPSPPPKAGKVKWLYEISNIV